jgi:hypothetical protein
MVLKRRAVDDASVGSAVSVGRAGGDDDSGARAPLSPASTEPGSPLAGAASESESSAPAARRRRVASDEVRQRKAEERKVRNRESAERSRVKKNAHYAGLVDDHARLLARVAVLERERDAAIQRVAELEAVIAAPQSVPACAAAVPADSSSSVQDAAGAAAEAEQAEKQGFDDDDELDLDAALGVEGLRLAELVAADLEGMQRADCDGVSDALEMDLLGELESLVHYDERSSGPAAAKGTAARSMSIVLIDTLWVASLSLQSSKRSSRLPRAVSLCSLLVHARRACTFSRPLTILLSHPNPNRSDVTASQAKPRVRS